MDSRIDHLSRKVNIKESSCLLNETIVKQHLKDLHSKYIIVPIDKATVNVTFICQQIYALVLVKELGLLSNNNSKKQTYKVVSNSNINTINIYSNILKIKCNINLDNANKKLPNMYWLRKLHKTP